MAHTELSTRQARHTPITVHTAPVHVARWRTQRSGAHHAPFHTGRRRSLRWPTSCPRAYCTSAHYAGGPCTPTLIALADTTGARTPRTGEHCTPTDTTQLGTPGPGAYCTESAHRALAHIALMVHTARPTLHWYTLRPVEQCVPALIGLTDTVHRRTPHFGAHHMPANTVSKSLLR